MTNKMKRHNAVQSAVRLYTETQLLLQKVRDHLDDGGLHKDKFEKADTHLCAACQRLEAAIEALR